MSQDSQRVDLEKPLESQRGINANVVGVLVLCGLMIAGLLWANQIRADMRRARIEAQVAEIKMKNKAAIERATAMAVSKEMDAMREKLGPMPTPAEVKPAPFPENITGSDVEARLRKLEREASLMETERFEAEAREKREAARQRMLDR